MVGDKAAKQGNWPDPRKTASNPSRGENSPEHAAECLQASPSHPSALPQGGGLHLEVDAVRPLRAADADGRRLARAPLVNQRNEPPGLLVSERLDLGQCSVILLLLLRTWGHTGVAKHRRFCHIGNVVVPVLCQLGGADALRSRVERDDLSFRSSRRRSARVPNQSSLRMPARACPRRDRDCGCGGAVHPPTLRCMSRLQSSRCNQKGMP
mmetsp:Transcript_93588/g.264627  ORF Transcript_93588/g.264627 Transcript_93588/m.264627 type:complete len:210 (-) Transcript_93588:30-659(-)